MQFRQLRTVTQKTLAGFMAIWLSGFVFLFCCDDISARITDAGSHQPDKMSAHCHADGDQTSHSVRKQTSEHEEFDCCGFIPMLLDKTRKVESNEQIVAVSPAVVVEKPILIPRQSVSASVISYRSAVLFRNDTYLKNRTFRI